MAKIGPNSGFVVTDSTIRVPSWWICDLPPLGPPTADIHVNTVIQSHEVKLYRLYTADNADPDGLLFMGNTHTGIALIMPGSGNFPRLPMKFFRYTDEEPGVGQADGDIFVSPEMFLVALKASCFFSPKS